MAAELAGPTAIAEVRARLVSRARPHLLLLASRYSGVPAKLNSALQVVDIEVTELLSLLRFQMAGNFWLQASKPDSIPGRLAIRTKYFDDALVNAVEVRLVDTHLRVLTIYINNTYVHIGYSMFVYVLMSSLSSYFVQLRSVQCFICESDMNFCHDFWYDRGRTHPHCPPWHR